MPHEYSELLGSAQAALLYFAPAHMHGIAITLRGCLESATVQAMRRFLYDQAQMAIGNITHLSYPLRHAPAFPLAVLDVCSLNCRSVSC